MTFPAKSTRYLIWSGLILLVLFLIALLGSVLVPFLVAAICSYALSPVVKLVQTKFKLIPRALAVLLVELVFLCVITLVMMLLLPIFFDIIPKLYAQLPKIWAALQSNLLPYLNRLGMHIPTASADLRDWLIKITTANGDFNYGSLFHSLKTSGSFAIFMIGNLVFIPVLLFYFLMDWDGMVRKIQHLIPIRLRPFADGLMRELSESLGQYLRGQILVMLCLAFFYSIALSFTGLSQAVSIGIFTGLAVCVPYVGFGVGLALAFLCAWLQFPPLGIASYIGLASIFTIGQLLESFFLTPRFVGERIGLSPLAVIFALIAFGQLLGFVGVLLALPLCSVGLVAGRHIKRKYLNSSLYND